MKKTLKTIDCVECGNPVTGSTNGEVMRNEMDHFRLYHPELYKGMIAEVPLLQLFNWLLNRIHGTPARI